MAKILKRGTSGGLLNSPDVAGALMAAPTTECCCGEPTCDCCFEAMELEIEFGSFSNDACSDCSDYHGPHTIDETFGQDCGDPDDWLAIPTDYFDGIGSEDHTKAEVCNSGLNELTGDGCGTGNVYWHVVHFTDTDNWYLTTGFDLNVSADDVRFYGAITYEDCTFTAPSMTRYHETDADCDYSSATCTVTVN